MISTIFIKKNFFLKVSLILGQSTILISSSITQTIYYPNATTTATTVPDDPAPLTYPYKTAEVPINNGTWQICSQNLTKYVSKYL